MPRGTPDYLSSSRATQGVLKQYTNSGTAPAGTEYWTVVEGKGVIRGGYFNSGQSATIFGLAIDDQDYVVLGHDTANIFGLTLPWAALFYLQKYIEGAGSNTFGLSPDITFEKNVKIKIIRPVTFTLVNIKIYYSLLL